MSSILDLTPSKLSLRAKQYLQVYDTMIIRYTSQVLEYMKNIFNTEYELPEGVVEVLISLFGFSFPDLTPFDDATRKSIKNNIFQNIIVFYKNRLAKMIYIQKLYTYGLSGNVYILETYDWINYFRTDETYFDSSKYTDIGLTTDMEFGSIKLDTDNIYRTPFIEIEINLDKIFNFYAIESLWNKDIDIILKKDIDSIRYLLTKIFYTLKLTVNANINQTITQDNSVVSVTGNVTDKFDIRKYRLTFSDDSTQIFSINDISDDEIYFYYKMNNKFLVDMNIKKVELLDETESIIFSIITFLNIYLKVGDNLFLDISIHK